MNWKLIRRAGAVARLAGLLLVTCVFTLPSATAQCIPEEVAKLVPLDGQPVTLFGFAVAIDGTTIVAGAAWDGENGPESGAAYVFERDDSAVNGWRQVAKILPSDGGPMDDFGYAVDISGDTIVVGAVGDSDNGADSGSAYIFVRDRGGPGNWGQAAKLLASDGAAADVFGISVSIHGDTSVIGAYFDDHIVLKAGSAYVFERNQGGANSWGEAAKLVAGDAAPGDRFGESVAIDGETVIVGAGGDDEMGLQAGAAYLFEPSGGPTPGWCQVAKLVASDGGDGDQFGAVSISGSTALVGAATDDQNGQYAGSAYIFERDEGGFNNWGEVCKIVPHDGGYHDHFGARTAIWADTAVIGAPLDSDNGLNSGSTYVFYRHLGGENQWGELVKLFPSDSAPWDNFGYPSVSGNVIAVGATKGFVPGALYVFDHTLPYPPIAYCTAKPASIPGCVPSIQGIGVASATSSIGFTLSSGTIPGQNLGGFLYTHSGTGDGRRSQFGTLCVSPFELYRTPPLFSGGSLGHCDGLLTFDWNAYAQSVVLTDPTSTMPGTTVDGQFWYRDPSSPGGGNLTDAIGFVVCR